ncbi:MAG: hypothetical protein E6J62_16910 [Deltaproteobacteria bacterium]|nr:MAG: hypothetical protein E6J62_16910 [Deltaproteobacteria bacterium]
MRGTLKLFAVLALLSGCAQQARNPVVGNGSCRCGPGQLCVREVSTTDAQGITCRDAHAAGCTAFASAESRCWPSADVAGLCLCTSDTAVAAAK